MEFSANRWPVKGRQVRWLPVQTSGSINVFTLILMNTTPNENLSRRKTSRSSLIYLVSPVVLVMLMLGSRYRILGLDELPYAIGYYLSKFFHWLF